MGKSKRLAEELVENPQPIEALETTKPATKIKMKGLDNELTSALVNYLETRPYGEVKGLLHSLSQAPVLDVTLIQDGTK